MLTRSIVQKAKARWADRDVHTHDALPAEPPKTPPAVQHREPKVEKPTKPSTPEPTPPADPADELPEQDLRRGQLLSNDVLHDVGGPEASREFLLMVDGEEIDISAVNVVTIYNRTREESIEPVSAPVLRVPLDVPAGTYVFDLTLRDGSQIEATLELPAFELPEPDTDA